VTAEAVEFDGVPPAFLYRPPRVRSLLSKVTKVCRSVNRLLEPEQALSIDVATGLKADGAPASLEAAIISPRQNLKTFCLEDIILTRMLDPDDSSRLFIWTAQQLDTTQETFLHFEALFTSDDFPHLQRRLRKITSGNGQEQIELVNGRRLKFKARSKKSGQGLTGDVVVFDEAFALEPAHMGALLPTLSTRRRATVLYGSSAGHEDSEVLRGVRDRGRKGGPGAPAYIEFCAPGSFTDPGCEFPGCRHTPDMQGCTLDREDFVQLANPMAGRRITWKFLRDERLSMPPLMYARERLGWWDEPDDIHTPPITVEAWRSRVDPESAIVDGGRVVLAAEIALDRKSGSIAAAGWRGDGKAHVGLVAHDGGTEWLLPRLIELARTHTTHEIKRGEKRCPAIILDPTSPAGTLIDPLRQAGIEPVLMTAREVATSCGDMQDALTDGTVWHRDTPTVDVAIGGAVRRDLGDGGWALGRRKSAAVSVDITPAVVVFNARWGLTQVITTYDLLDSVV
jgi:hypothetical protein